MKCFGSRFGRPFVVELEYDAANLKLDADSTTTLTLPKDANKKVKRIKKGSRQTKSEATKGAVTSSARISRDGNEGKPNESLPPPYSSMTKKEKMKKLVFSCEDFIDQKNVENHLKTCLEALGFFDEKVVAAKDDADRAAAENSVWLQKTLAGFDTSSVDGRSSGRNSYRADGSTGTKNVYENHAIADDAVAGFDLHAALSAIDAFEIDTIGLFGICSEGADSTPTDYQPEQAVQEQEEFTFANALAEVACGIENPAFELKGSGNEENDNEDDDDTPVGVLRRKAAAVVEGGQLAGWLALNRDLMDLL